LLLSLDPFDGWPAEARPLHLTLTDLKIGHYMHGTTFLALRLPVARLARLVLPVRELVALPLVRARLVRLRVLPAGSMVPAALPAKGISAMLRARLMATPSQRW